MAIGIKSSLIHHFCFLKAALFIVIGIYKLPIVKISPMLLKGSNKKKNVQEVGSLVRMGTMLVVISLGAFIYSLAQVLIHYKGIWVIVGVIFLPLLVIAASISLKLVFLHFLKKKLL